MIEILKEKPLKSTTAVEGVLVHASNGNHYGITRQFISRNGWFLRGADSTKTGKISMQNVFMKRCNGKPEIEEGTAILLQILNGEAEPIHDKVTY
jgi:hypothetical protein